MNIIRSIVILLTLALVTLPGQSNTHENGHNIEYRRITAPEVKNMLAQNNALLIHVLSQLEYEMQHISGSINIPFNEVSTTKKLPEDKDVPLIFYCMGEK